MFTYWMALALAGAIAVMDPSLRAVVQRAPAAADGSVALTVRLEATEMKLGAYQGTLRFTPGTLEVLSVDSPRGDGTRVVNPADSAQGIVRFAGFTVTGFRTDSVLTLRVRPKRALAQSGVRVLLEVASDVDGKALPRAALREATFREP